MARTKGASDRTPRVRRTNAQLAEAQEQHNQRLARTLERVRAREAGQIDDEREPQYQQMRFEKSEDGELTLGSIEAVFEDSVLDEEIADDDEGRSTKSIPSTKQFFQESSFGRFAAEVVSRIQHECKQDTAPNTKPGSFHLISYLKQQGFWLHKTAAPFLVQQLGMPPTTNTDYFQDIKIWMPDLQWGKLAMPCCPSCNSNTHVCVNKATNNHPVRRIISIEKCYFIASRQYCCTACREAAKTLPKDKKPQYTFMATHENCLKNLRPEYATDFPAILSHKSGVDRVLYRMLRPLFDASVQAAGISKMLLELHSLKYYDTVLAFLSEKERDIALSAMPDERRRESLQYSTFDDPRGYAGAAPSPKYILDMYKKQCETIRPFLENEVKKVECEMIQIDSSKKAPKKICQHNGQRSLEDLVTIANGSGEVRSQALLSTDAHDQIKNPIEAMRDTIKSRNQVQPKLASTDNVPRDRQFLLDTFPSLQQSQKIFDKYADKLNEDERKEATPSASEMLDEIDKTMTAQFREEGASSSDAPNADKTKESTTHEIQDIDSKVDKAVLDGDKSIVVPETQINIAIPAMLHDIGAEDGGTFAVDIEWPTKTTRSGNKVKVGNVGVLQIGYVDKENRYRAMVCQLPRNTQANLPRELLAFLKDKSNKLLGVGLSADLKQLEKDFRNFHHTDVPLENIINVSAMARDRDLAYRDNESVESLGKNVLGILIDKRDEIRCSNWALRTLTQDQIRYAGLDVVRVFQIYDKILPLPDLSARLFVEEAVVGTAVDVVPPYARVTRRAESGFAVSDLATRAGIGRIVDTTRVAYPPGMIPRHAESVHGNSVVVEITEVLAEGMTIPKHKTNGRRSCLGDFGKSPFKVVLPLTMLRHHIEPQKAKDLDLVLRTYESPRTHVSRQHTRPSTRSQRHDAGGLERNEVTATADDDDEIMTSKEEDWLDFDGDDEEELQDAFGKLEEVVGRLLNEDDNDQDLTSDDREAALNIMREQLETIRKSTLMARKAEGGDKDILFSRHLEDVPDEILYKFSAVLGDIFHAIQRTRVPVKHEYKKGLYFALMNAFFVWDEIRLEEVKSVLREKAGMTDDDISNLMYYSPAFFAKRVARHVPGPRQLYIRVRAVYCAFGEKIDSKTNRPLFNKEAWTKARQVLREIIAGYYSDPPGIQFYSYEINDDGSVRRDKWGIELLHCSRGTNLVENIHRSYNRTFRYKCGFELGDCLLAERRHRHNINIARRRRDGYPKVGHYDTWLIDRLKLLSAKVLKKTIFKCWTPSIMYRDTPETFVTVAIHSKEIGERLTRHWEADVDQDKVKLTRDQQFNCKQTDVPLPFLPVTGHAEKSLFSKILHERNGKLDSNAIALEWIKHVDGVNIFPKLPAQVRVYFKKWERNVRIKRAEREMMPERQALENLHKKNNPVMTNSTTRGEDNSVQKRSHSQLRIGSQTTAFPSVSYPYRQPALTVQAAHNFQGSAFVGQQLIWSTSTTSAVAPPPKKRGRKLGSSDKETKIRERHCKLCRERYGKSDDFSSTCPGRNNRRNCVSEKDHHRSQEAT